MTLYPATTNIGKFAEFAAAASPDHITFAKLPGIDDMPEPVEDASTFMGNAEIKARAYSLLAPGLLILADDSGLEVPSLDNAPGVRSARFADDQAFGAADGCKDTRNNLCLLSALSASANPDRSARYVCALAVARDGNVLLRSEGEVAGEILPAPHGAGGFGYDPLFFIPAEGRTMAELSRNEKWKISHRGNAFRSLLSQLTSTQL